MRYKQALMDQLAAKMEQELAVLTQAVRAAHEAATHEESKAEDQHDTRGLEASYLAGAQAKRALELQQQLAVLRATPLREFQPADPVGLGAWVELGLEGKKSHYFLLSHGGGLTVQVDGRTVQVITPRAPLGSALLGKRVGDTIELEAQNSLREYELLSVS